MGDEAGIERNLGEFISLYKGTMAEALVDTREPQHRSWTYPELNRASASLARGLLASGVVKKGDRVAIVAENSAEFLCAISAIMRAGLTAVPVNLWLPESTVRYIVEDAECKLVFIDRVRPCNAQLIIPKVTLYGDGPASLKSLIDVGEKHGHLRLPIAAEEDDCAYILYTSGSTGRPKGVQLTHRGQAWALAAIIASLSRLAGNQTLIAAPCYHMNGLFFSMACLASGVGVVLMPRFEPKAYIEALSRYRCAFLSGIPTMFAMLARERALLAGRDLSFVVSITMGSSALTGKLLNDVRALFPKAEIRNAFGTTEGGPWVFGAHPAGMPMPPLSMGCAAEGVELELVDGPTPDLGTLRMRSPAVMRGYLKLPEETTKRLQDGWYYTGDVMRRDENGFFFYVGRADDMFVCGGENVYPSQVESLLERHPAIAQVAVVAAPDDIKGQIPIAFVVRRPGSNLTEEDVKAFALREGPAFSHPRHVRFLDQLPLAASQKYDRNALIQAAQEIAKEQGGS